jgi:hypothetical protein
VDGRVEEERERRIRAHVSRCKTCGPAEPRMRETRRQLAGLALLALPDAERDALLARVSAAARRLLPAARPPVRSRRTPLLRAPVVALSLAVAAILGSAVGAITADDTPNAPAASTGIVTEPTVQPSGATTAPSATTSSRLPTRSSAPRTTSAPPSTAPASTTPPPVRTTTPPPVTTTSPPTPIGPADLTLSPTSGPNSTVITVVGSGWTPGRRVQLTYLDVLGRPTGSGGEASPGPRGTFRTTIAAFDPSNIPGPHTVVATNGVSEVRRTFRAT